MTRVLIVDDDPLQLRLAAEAATAAGFTPLTAIDGRSALDLLRTDRGIGAVVLDLVMPDLDGMAVLEIMAREGVSQPVIVALASASPETVVSATRAGAVDFFVKPATPERLAVAIGNALRRGALEQALRTTRDRADRAVTPADIVAASPGMQRVLSLCGKAARSPVPVLIEGEAGTGRQTIARLLQGLGDRAGKPFVAVDCATLPPALLEPTLFGHRPGALSRAASGEPGSIAEAHGGILYLDGIGELPPALQARLLRLVETGEYQPVGGTRMERVNIRIIASTSERLLNLARSGAFREDLYYRLNVFPIYLPPLRERREDIPPLVDRFIASLAAAAGRRIAGASPAALTLLAACDWPGNIRQLENAVDRAIALAGSAMLEPADFPHISAQVHGRAHTLTIAQSVTRPSEPVHIDFANVRIKQTEGAGTIPDRFLTKGGEIMPLVDLERELIAFAVRKYQGRMSHIARALKIGRSTLYRKLREYGLDAGLDSDAA